MAVDESTWLSLQNKFLENKSGRIFFAFDKFTLQILAQNLGVCKPAFYTFYATHLGWNCTIYHADLGQNAVFHNFFKDELHSVIQDDQSWAFSETDQKISKITHMARWFSFLVRAVSMVECLNKL